jgi:hypothetical protein
MKSTPICFPHAIKHGNVGAEKALRATGRKGPARAEATKFSTGGPAPIVSSVMLRALRQGLPSRPGEFHPEPLTVPDLILSHHPARAIAQSLSASTERKAPPGYARLAQISGDDLPPSLQPHYRAFVTTTRQSAPLRRIGTFGLTVIAA